MGESYSRLNTAPLLGSIFKSLMSTNCLDNNRKEVNNITINIYQENSNKNRCKNKNRKMNKLIPVIEFL